MTVKQEKKLYTNNNISFEHKIHYVTENLDARLQLKIAGHELVNM
jgi:hypothetical protein